MENDKKHKVRNKVGYIVGSMVLFAAACMTIPAALAAATGMLYKAAAPRVKDDDWGPVIERKDKVNK